ncbi:MAG: polyprenol phosphomannose-dependent alpha 1,6 mannosyltransferase MptB [Propionibacteriaceae bacterium]|jgi:alpha-1,6-mannosyltransferase|nr:polyprenol phosphomannose-dependent alpha 1,6 mannosyltransferase MptB [Propionibacteriaceae bacterium]
MTTAPTSSISSLKREFGVAWAQFPVRVGLLGTLIIAVGSLTPAYLPQASPMWPVLRMIGLAGQLGRIGGTILTVSGVFLLVDSWFRLRHREYGHLNPFAVVGLWSLPFLVAPPLFSHDMYSYGAQGWMIHNGQNPYDGGPALVPGPFADYAPWVWRFTPAPYGPLALQISHLVVDLSGGRPWLAALLMRIPAILGVVAVLVLLPRIADRLGVARRHVVWFACLNPLLVIDYVGGGHNDAWMMGLVVVALWLALRPRWWPWAAMIIGVAAGIKQPAALAAVFLPFLAAADTGTRPRDWARAAGRAGASVAIAVAVFVGLTFATGLGFGWIGALGVPGTVASVSPAFLIGVLLQTIFSPGGTFWLTLVARITMAAAVLVVVYVTVRYGRRQPLKALAWSWLAVALGAQALHSWYLLWGGLLLPFAKPRRGVPQAAAWVVILLLCYAAVNLGDRNGVFATIAAVVCVLAWLAHIMVYHRFWPRSRAAEEAE